MICGLWSGGLDLMGNIPGHLQNGANVIQASSSPARLELYRSPITNLSRTSKAGLSAAGSTTRFIVATIFSPSNANLR